MDNEEVKSIPQGESFWWGRTRGCHYWNLLIEVRGESPFCRLNIWDLKENIFVKDADPFDVCEFGPKIADKPPEVVGKRDDWS